MTGRSHSADELAAKLTDSISIDGEASLVRSSDGSMEIAGPITLELGDAAGDPTHDSVDFRIDGTYSTLR